MKCHQAIGKAIVFIENHLNEPIKASDVAGAVSYSYYHFHRYFSAVMGENIGSYIRSRRLTQAAWELVHSEKRVLDIGLSLYFESAESFTRAFKSRYGIMNYTQKDGLLYPDIDTGSEELKQLEKYGKMRLEYIHARKPALYRELLFTGKLAEHCQQIEAEAFKLSEQLQADYISKNPLPEDDFWMRVSTRMMAQMVADEVVLHSMIYT